MKFSFPSPLSRLNYKLLIFYQERRKKIYFRFPRAVLLFFFLLMSSLIKEIARLYNIGGAEWFMNVLVEKMKSQASRGWGANITHYVKLQ